MGGERLRISVVIPTYEREDLLCQCIEDVLTQQYEAFETIVVDQTRQHLPATQAFLKSVEGQVRILRLERPSVTAACNAGGRVASGTILVFLDDDVRIRDPSFLRHHETCYANPTVGVVAGRVSSH